MPARLLIITFAAVTGCGRLGFEPGNLDGRDRDADRDSAPDAEVALCPVIDERFDSALGSTWLPYTSGGAPAPVVTNGSLVLDVPTPVSTCSIGTIGNDLHDAVITVTALDYTFVFGTQVYLEIGVPGRYFALNALADLSLGEIVARIQTGVSFDDVTLPLSMTASMRLRLAVSPVSGGSQVVWSYATSETTPFIEVRRETVTDDFTNVDFGVSYQVWSTAPTDPPPIRIDDFQLAHPCM